MKKATKLTKKQRRAARAAASARKSLEQPEQQPDEKPSGQSSEELWQTVTRRCRLTKLSPSPPTDASPTVTSNPDMAGGDGLRSTKASSASKGRRGARGDAKQPIHKVAATPKSIRSWVNSQQGSAAPALQPLTVSAVGQSSVYATPGADVDQEWPILDAAVSSAKSQAPAQMLRLPSAQASASPEVPARLATAQAANDDDEDSSSQAADSAVATGILTSSSAASVPAEGDRIHQENLAISSASAASGASAVSAGMNMIPAGNLSDVSAATLELQPSSPSSAITGQPACQAAFPGDTSASSPPICRSAPSFTFEAADCGAQSATDTDASVSTSAHAAVFGTFPDLRGVHISLFPQQSGYLETPLLGGTRHFTS